MYKLKDSKEVETKKYINNSRNVKFFKLFEFFYKIKIKSKCSIENIYSGNCTFSYNIAK